VPKRHERHMNRVQERAGLGPDCIISHSKNY
jgi:hypothetical protein